MSRICLNMPGAIRGRAASSGWRSRCTRTSRRATRRAGLVHFVRHDPVRNSFAVASWRELERLFAGLTNDAGTAVTADPVVVDAAEPVAGCEAAADLDDAVPGVAGDAVGGRLYATAGAAVAGGADGADCAAFAQPAGGAALGAPAAGVAAHACDPCRQDAGAGAARLAWPARCAAARCGAHPAAHPPVRRAATPAAALPGARTAGWAR